MRRTSILILLLLFAAHELSAGFLPKRRAPRKPTQSGASFNYRTQRGPQYSPATQGSFSADEVQNLVQESNNPLNQIAQDAIGIGGGGSCDTSVISQVDALTAQLRQLEAKALAAQTGAYSCGTNPSCLMSYANQLIAIGNQTVAVGNQLMGLKGRYEQAMQCQAQGGGSGGGSKAVPPGVTTANLAKRLKATPPGAGGSGSGGFSSGAFDDLQDSVADAGIPDYDGRGRAQSKSLARYQRAAAAARQIGARVDAGRDFANKPARDFSDPSAAARQEYLRINYEVLGPKYEKLAQQRSETADAFAHEVLASAPAMPLPSDEPPVIKLSESQAELAKELGEGMADEIETSIEEALTEGWDKRSKALLGIGKINRSLFEGLDELAGDLPGALAELGSGSLDTAKLDAFQEKLQGFFGSMAEVSQEAAAEIAGYNPDPKAKTEDAVRGWMKQRFGGGGAD